MASKLIVIRQRLAAALHAAFAAFAGEVSPVLDERVGPFLDSEDAEFDFAALQRALARMVAASRDRLVAADKAHLDELASDIATRCERDRRVKAVRDKLIEIRGVLGGLFGAERTREIVAVDGSTAEQPELLWRQGEHTVSRLRDPEVRLPAATTRAVHLDLPGFADELEPDVKALRRAIDGIGVDVQEAAVTVQVKKEAMAEHDRLMSACGRILSGLCLLADRPDLARQVRVTPPRKPAGKKAGETPALPAIPHPDPLPQGERAPPPTRRQEGGETPALPAGARSTKKATNGATVVSGGVVNHRSREPGLAAGSVDARRRKPAMQPTSAGGRATRHTVTPGIGGGSATAASPVVDGNALGVVAGGDHAERGACGVERCLIEGM